MDPYTQRLITHPRNDPQYTQCVRGSIILEFTVRIYTTRPLENSDGVGKMIECAILYNNNNIIMRKKYCRNDTLTVSCGSSMK